MTTRLSSPAASEDFAARVLIVDDNPTNLQVLLQTLDGRGHELLAATNGEDALRIAGTERPALVLLDVMMSGIDGYEVCRRLKANPATEPSAVTCATSPRRWRSRQDDDGGAAYTAGTAGAVPPGPAGERP